MFVRLSAAIAALGLLTGAALAQGAKPTDPQIAHIAYTAGELDRAAGEQALAKSKNQAVREFAQTMVRDHSAVNRQALALVQKLGIKPDANATSAGLTQQAEAKARELSGLSGAAFDRAYVLNEIVFHRTVNGALATTLIPNAKNPELRSLLQTGLTLFREHQQHAEHLAQDLR